MADMTRINMRVRGAEVITVPIDDTLTIEGQAADAKATGDALAQKADKSELQAAVKVNNQPADAQGLILIDGRHIPVSDQDAETLAEAVTDLKGQTAENIPMSSDSGAKTIAEVVNANAEAIENMEEMTGATMPIESGSQTTVKAAIEARVKTVNQKAPDPDGNVDLSVVPLAENLQSDKMQSVDGTFIIRTTGGSSSVSDGKAYPQHIMGTSERTGYVAEELNMTVIPIERTEPDEPITATIDRDVFVAYVDESGTINLYYTTEWSEDPELYGVTVEGTPVAGDQIQIVYVKEQRGTIQVSNPERLVGTGWNLFNFNAGYARVVRYSDKYGYKIGGAFTSIEYSATPEGDRVSILTGQNGLFQVPGDGYVFVNGGNATDTYILATWSDWTDGPATGYWEAYKESGIDLSAVMGTYFPYGLLSVGNIHDEIDLSAKRTISRVERMAYTAENLEAAIASGREFTYDTNYIYLERAEYVISAITIDTVYNVSEHGLEWFTGTTMPLITEILYGKNLRDKLERDVLTISQQTLAEEEKAQVRRNIGVMDPPLNGNGTAAQLLKTNGDGTTEWTTQGTPTDAQVGTAVSAWLTDHPEATTTVQDGAISRAKLNDDLKAKTDAVPDLKSELIDNNIISPDRKENYYCKKANGTLIPTSSYGYLEAIDIGGYAALHIISNFPSGDPAICFYKENGDWISSASSSTTESPYSFDEIVPVPKGAYMVRVSCIKTYLGRASITTTLKEFLGSLRNYVEEDFATGIEFDALNEEVSILDGMLLDNNIMNPSRYENHYAQTGTGALIENSSYGYVEASNIDSYPALHVITQMSGRVGICFYDSNGDYVSSVENTGSGVEFNEIVPVPKGAYMVRVSCIETYLNNVSIKTTLKEFLGTLKEGVLDCTPLQDFTNVKNDLESLYSEEPLSVNNVIWEQGALSSDDGHEVTTNGYIRTKKISRNGYNSAVIELDSASYQYFLFTYGADDGFLPTDSYNGVVLSGRSQIYFDDDVDYFRISLKRTDSTNPTVNDGKHISVFGETMLQNATRTGFIPDYYFEDDYLIDKVNRINELHEKYAANGTAFVFITDEHFEHPRYNTQNSPAIIGYLYKRTHINMLVDGGDSADKGSALWWDLLRKHWGGKIYHVIGNHEYFNCTDEKEQQLYALCDTYNNDQIGVNERHYYYVDNPQEKLRYIVLNGYQPSGSTSIISPQNGYETAQLDWLRDVGLNVQSGWGIIIFLHGIYGFNAGESGMGEGYYIPTSSNDQALLDVIENYSGDGEIISLISGHQHLDRVIYTSRANICVIFTTCDANTVTRYVTEDPRTAGTIGEQAFDTFILDRPNHTWHIVRIGTKAYDGIGSDPGDAVEERTVDYRYVPN